MSVMRGGVGVMRGHECHEGWAWGSGDGNSLVSLGRG